MNEFHKMTSYTWNFFFTILVKLDIYFLGLPWELVFSVITDKQNWPIKQQCPRDVAPLFLVLYSWMMKRKFGLFACFSFSYVRADSWWPRESQLSWEEGQDERKSLCLKTFSALHLPTKATVSRSLRMIMA